MGAWGHGVFQSDRSHDLIGELSDLAGAELFFFKTSSEEQSTKKALDSGLLTKMIEKLSKSEGGNGNGNDSKIEASHDENQSQNKEEKSMLAALVMNIGSNLPEEFKKEVQGYVGDKDKIDWKSNEAFGDGYLMLGQDQICAALKGYKNDGRPWNSRNKGLMETMLSVWWRLLIGMMESSHSLVYNKMHSLSITQQVIKEIRTTEG